MTTASLIFWIIFVLPLLAFLVWVLKQDKRKGTLGIIVLSVIVVVVVIYMAWNHMFQTGTATVTQ